MANAPSNSSHDIDRTAYAWVEREHLGLTANEQAELDAWLSSDMRHFEAFDEFKVNWARFDVLGNQGAREVPSPAASRYVAGRSEERLRIVPLRVLAPWLGIAAALALGWFLWRPSPSVTSVAATPILFPAMLVQQTLDDGTVVELNRNASMTAAFNASERRVLLERGEANFAVAKNPERPFIVEVGAVEVRALGTAFNVRYHPESVQVVVTEGKVRVDAPPVKSADGSTRQTSILGIGQKVTVPLTTAARVAVVTLAPAQMEQELLWQAKLLDFDNAVLVDIVAEFNRRNPVHLVIADETLRTRRMSATFRSDNVEGFVRLLETHFSVRSDYRGGGEIALTTK